MGSNGKSRMKISTATITKQSGEARCPRSPIIHTSVRISLKLAVWNTRSRKEKQESRRATVKRTVVGPTTTRNRIFSTLFFSYPLFSLFLLWFSYFLSLVSGSLVALVNVSFVQKSRPSYKELASNGLKIKISNKVILNNNFV